MVERHARELLHKEKEREETHNDRGDVRDTCTKERHEEGERKERNICTHTQSHHIWQ